MKSLSRDLRSIPNLITLSRIVIIAVAVPLYFNGFPGTAILLGALAGVTDHLDGILARRLNQVTDLGEVLDQFSDLMLESVVLLMLVSHPQGPSEVVLVVYLARELWVMTIRRFMASRQMNIKSSMLGKVKSNFLGWAFVPYFAALHELIPAATPYLKGVGIFGLAGGLAISYVSAWQYTRQFAAGYNSQNG